MRFEVLPLDRTIEEVERLPLPLQLTVTCSPKHGPDRTVEISERLRALARAVAGGASDAVLAAVQGGVATLVTALIGGT